MKNCTEFFLIKLISFLFIGFYIIGCAPKHESEKGPEFPELRHHQLSESSLMPNAYVIEELEPSNTLPRLPLPVPAEKRPSKEMLAEYFNASKYGVWVDDRRIENADLINYDVDDFEYYMISSLEKNAAHYGLYDYHVTLLTSTGFKNLKARLKLQGTGKKSL